MKKNKMKKNKLARAIIKYNDSIKQDIMRSIFDCDEYEKSQYAIMLEETKQGYHLIPLVKIKR